MKNRRKRKPSASFNRNGLAISIEIDMPDAFSTACRQFHVGKQEALQFFADHLLFAAYVLKETGDIYSMTTTVFAAYTNTLSQTPIANEAKRQICIKYTKQVIAILSGNEQSVSYTATMKEWYEKLHQNDQYNS
ncbi:hypothetical protein [Chitinophaga sp. LS1]|uniref:hypothetical protein n=1 Tax=Chitinophaga sp. LS1 TaxID=3051176 RepID=UPI002AAB2CA5|nr:hypothetical protein [Chitinophaga sp. LS1]WPV65421.1 hypothetical protein QQL36_26830 [Chitinophaga sp. LS1]